MFFSSFHPSPVLISLGWLEIRWYGFFITLGLVVGFFIAQKLFKKYNLAEKHLYDLLFYLLIFGLLGARLWHVLSEINYYIINPWDTFKIWNGGLAIHGALVAGILVIYFFAKKHKLNLLLLLDIFAPLLILGQAFGRWGNYFNQELYGPPSNSFFAIPIDLAHRLPGFEQYSFFHPNFLYESAWCFIVFFILISLHIVRLRFKNQKLDDKKLLITHYSLLITNSYGVIFALYLILYSIERFLIGFLRIDQQGAWLGFRQDQWISLILIAVGLGLILFIKKRK